MFGVHGVGGATGTLLAGVFATASVMGVAEPAGLLEGNGRQVLLQLYGIAVTLVWSGLVTFVLLKVIAFFIPLRVTDQEELMGLDIALHGESIHS